MFFGPCGGARARTVLVESFGAMSCVECPAARHAVDTLDVEFGEGVVAVEYHSAAPFATAGATARAAYYGIGAEPAAFFDGGTPFAGADSLPGAYRDRVAARIAAPSLVIFDAVSVFHASTRAGSLSVEVHIEEAVPNPEDVVLRAVVTENGVDACCDPDGGRTWNRVVRRVLDDRALVVSGMGEIQFEQWALPLDADWSVTDLRAVAFLQRDTDGDILGAALAADAGSLLPLPFSGLDESAVHLLPSRPNPLRSGEATILFTLPDPDYAKVQILNGAGRVVRVLTDGPRPEGVQDVRWDGTDYLGNRMANGVYVYRLETSAGVRSRKLTLIR
jgi:hypothetical protein